MSLDKLGETETDVAKMYILRSEQALGQSDQCRKHVTTSPQPFLIGNSVYEFGFII
jgi:hypothetical protein